jgi:hypothetical protein
LALVAETRGTPVPERCAVVVEDDSLRLLTVVRSADGTLLNHFDAARTHALGEGLDVLTPPQLDALRGCEHVRVLASPSALGLARLLPERLAWSYQLGRERRHPRQSGSLLVVHNVEPPRMLRLPHLPTRKPPEEAPGQAALLELSGAQASPSRLLAEMPRATEIEIHAHGIYRPELFDAPFIALSPDAEGRYALDMSAWSGLPWWCSPRAGRCEAALPFTSRSACRPPSSRREPARCWRRTWRFPTRRGPSSRRSGAESAPALCRPWP